MRSTEINCNHNVQNHLRSTATTLDEDNSSVFAKFWNFVLQTAQNQQNRSKIRKWKIFTRMEFWVIQSPPGMSRKCHAGVTQVSRDGIQILWSPSGSHPPHLGSFVLKRCILMSIFHIFIVLFEMLHFDVHLSYFQESEQPSVWFAKPPGIMQSFNVLCTKHVNCCELLKLAANHCELIEKCCKLL